MATKSPRDTEIEAILEKVRQVRNFDFRNYKRATLQRRIERRMAATGCRTRHAYLALLERDANEVSTLVSSMLIKLTTFFRDREVWTSLDGLIRELVQRRRQEQELRIWSAGCATGEEAYSIAIAAAEALGPGYPGPELKVFGTDVDEEAIAFARRGIYTKRQLEGCSKERLARWFVPTGSGYTVRKEIRRSVVFGINNLVSDAPVSRLDVILCRNVFIYLDAELQKRVLARFHFALRQQGMLVLGRSELIPYAARLFEPVDLARRIYRKDSGQEAALNSRERLEGLLAQEALAASEGQAREASRLLPRDVLDSLPYPCIVTDAEGTVTLWSQAAARRWGRREADVVGKRLASLGLPGLSQELLVEQSARVRAGRSECEVADGTLEQPGQEPLALRTEVVPLRTTSGGAHGLLYATHDITALHELERKFQRANEDLQAVNLRLQASIEELRASNEELETTNEELQSANAELDATNRELAHRTQELDSLSFFQRTIIRTLSVGVLVLDSAGRITTWNLAAERLLGLPEREAVGQVLWTLRIPTLKRSLMQRVRKYLADSRSLRLEDVDYQLPHGGRGRATVVATPLITESTVLGAVILFEDTTRASALAQENRELKERRKK